MIEVLPTEKLSPRQALLCVDKDVDDIEQVAVVYIRKGEYHPRMTCSTMTPSDMNFLAVALQHYSLKFLER